MGRVERKAVYHADGTFSHYQDYHMGGNQKAPNSRLGIVSKTPVHAAVQDEYVDLEYSNEVIPIAVPNTLGVEIAAGEEGIGNSDITQEVTGSTLDNHEDPLWKGRAARHRDMGFSVKAVREEAA